MALVEALKRLQEYEADLRKRGIVRLYVFGSTARGEQRADSDVDLFFDDTGQMSFFKLMDIKERAAEIQGYNADIMSHDSIGKFVRPAAELRHLLILKNAL